MMPKNILIIVAHLMMKQFRWQEQSKHVINGDSVRIISMTDGVSARLTSKNKDAKWRKSAENAAKILGFSWEAIHNFR